MLFCNVTEDRMIHKTSATVEDVEAMARGEVWEVTIKKLEISGTGASPTASSNC